MNNIGRSINQKMMNNERIEYYKNELIVLTFPKTFREQVLVKVYRSLLQSCLDQAAVRLENPENLKLH